MTTRSFLRRTLGLGFVAGLGYAVWRAIEANRTTPAGEWEAQPFPFPPQPRRHEPDTDGSEMTRTTTVETAMITSADGSCPLSHPVKAGKSSKIFHVPGGANYERTHADRCYLDAAAAEADGLRAAKR